MMTASEIQLHLALRINEEFRGVVPTYYECSRVDSLITCEVMDMIEDGRAPIGTKVGLKVSTSGIVELDVRLPDVSPPDVSPPAEPPPTIAAPWVNRPSRHLTNGQFLAHTINTFSVGLGIGELLYWLSH